MVRALQPVNASPERREKVQPVPTKAFLHLAKAAAMCMASCAETCPPPPIPSSKRIAPTYNIQPKLHDKYTIISD